MKRVSVNIRPKTPHLEEKICLKNGAILLLKKDEEIFDVFMIVPFRDNGDRYRGDLRDAYCSLISLNDGHYAFDERCSRSTTVRRVLNHMLRLGNGSYEYNAAIPVEEYKGYDVEIKSPDSFRIDISF